MFNKKRKATNAYLDLKETRKVKSVLSLYGIGLSKLFRVFLKTLSRDKKEMQKWLDKLINKDL